MSDNVLVSIKGVDKIFHRGDEVVHALRSINLDIIQGEYLSIMGPSGSGKSTLFNVIGALDKPTNGEVLVGGISLPKLSSLELSYFRCKHIGYVFQSYNLIPQLTALGNVMMPLTFLGKPDHEARERALETLKYVGLDQRVDHRPGELSGGQQQRVAIARALANDPSIILADEPTANLDIETGQMIIDIFKKLSTDFGTTIITATHDHKMLAKSDRIVWIKEGQVDRLEEVRNMNIKVGSLT
ncbi:MAG: ABC transporter ATP-binding protein [Planctomycetes bacterium]|nr:ABC transporter ATP-binding protein [Planctomycetota bacterium]